MKAKMIIIHTPNSHHLAMFGLSNRLTDAGYCSTADWEKKEILTDAPRNIVEKVIKNFLGLFADDPVG